MVTEASPIVTDSSHQCLSLAQQVVFNFVPGIVMTLAFVALAWLTKPLGWPPSLALLLAWPVAGIPILVGLMFYYGRQQNGVLSLKGVLLYRERLPWPQYLWLVPVLFIWSAVVSTLFFPLGESLRHNLPFAWPEWLNLSALAQDTAQYLPAILWVVVALSAVLNIAVPILEELYFRSFLLPRFPAAPRWAPFSNTVLFSLYHLWWPWDMAGRIIALLPVVYVVQWKRNVAVSILVHCLLNLTGTIGLAALIMGVSSG
ncbi:MAG: CPBP family intramembrane metalloprotease [Anaerolineae bacterium]|nr:CPBP family intramembrane metalloprotease [Anaerolineae bacterium]